MSDALTHATSRDLADLRPDIRASVEQLLSRLEQRGMAPYVAETRRSPERAAYMAKIGTSKAGVRSLHVGDPGHVRAADIVDGRHDSKGRPVLWGGSYPDDPPELSAARRALAAEFFRIMGEEVPLFYLTWGGAFRSLHDPAHVERS